MLKEIETHDRDVSMKLISLSPCSIGPYADAQTVDFTKFGHNLIFLIEGPTGAGKSTILNAITFAFYGEVGIDTSQNKRLMRSLCPRCECCRYFNV